MHPPSILTRSARSQDPTRSPSSQAKALHTIQPSPSPQTRPSNLPNSPLPHLTQIPSIPPIHPFLATLLQDPDSKRHQLGCCVDRAVSRLSRASHLIPIPSRPRNMLFHSYIPSLSAPAWRSEAEQGFTEICSSRIRAGQEVQVCGGASQVGESCL